MLKPEEIAKVVDRVKAGDAEAFEQLYDAYSPAMYGISIKIVGQADIAEDVVQEAFVKIWKNIASYSKKKGSIFTWMLNICRNAAIDKYRKLSKKRAEPIHNEENIVSVGKAHQSNQNINTIGIQDLVKVLPAEEQLVLEYLYFKGYTQKEASEELGIPLGTVKTRSRKAIRSLKELFVLLATWI